MKKKTKIWLLTAASLVLIGSGLFAGVMSMLEWDFTKLSTVKYETNIYEVSDIFDGISIGTDTADIEFVLSNDGKCRVECHEEANAKHSVAVADGILTVELIDERYFIGYIGVNFGSPKITVCLPKMEYANLLIHGDTGDIQIPKDFCFDNVEISLSTGDVVFCASASEMIKIKTSTGDIRAENIFAGELELAVSTGDVTLSCVNCMGNVTVGVSTGKAYLNDITCKNVVSIGNTGDIFLNHVIASENFSVERSTGDVTLDASDAAGIFIKTDTGDVEGSLLTDKVFAVSTNTGDTVVPNTTVGGRCEITTNTGDVKLRIQ